MLAQVEDNTSTSTGVIAVNIGTNHKNVWNVLHDQLLHQFHCQCLRDIHFENYPRHLNFAR